MGDERIQDEAQASEISGTIDGGEVPAARFRPCPTGTPDEQIFPSFAASFHKLFEHFPAGSTGAPDLTGLLTDSGVANYENFRKALQGGPTGEPFDDCLLDRLTLLNRNPSAPRPCPGDPRLTARRAVGAFEIFTSPNLHPFRSRICAFKRVRFA
ncbi:MAG TPA: hypothetical protein VF548_13215 [Allosphingosinicella sp.]|jgi:hypothetical protein